MRRWMVAGLTAGLAVAHVACSAGPAPALRGDAAEPRVRDGVEYRAEVAVLESFPVQLHAVVRIENTTDRDVDLTFPDGCVVLLEAHADAARTGEPAWDQASQVSCAMALVPLRLEPGESREYAVQVTAAEVLGDSLAAGRYHLTAVVRPRGVRVEIPAGPVELAK